MNPFNFLGDVFNQMLINPRSTEVEKKDQHDLKIKFEELYGKKNYFLVASSGSSTHENTSIKLIALHRNAVLNSAARVNSFFNLDQRSNKFNFGCVLPLFHVGGLGIYARAFLSRGPVFQKIWNPLDFSNWIEINKIHILSLVPAQIFDLVKHKIQAPACVKIVFVGGSSLSPELRILALDLKWPLIETYGMTETSSMIAVAENEMQVLPDIQVGIDQQKLKIKCDSLMTCSLQKMKGQIEINTLNQGWLQTEDIAEIRKEKDISFITLLGRTADFIKINSEGVSLVLLRNIFGEVAEAALVAIANLRSEFEIAAAYEKNFDQNELKNKINNYNLKVRPFEKIKKMFRIENIPKTDLGKIKYRALEEIIKGIEYEIL